MDENNGSKATYSALSFQFLLEKLILWAIREAAQELDIKTDIPGISATPKIISLREIREGTLITYQTAIALNLSHQWNKPVNDVAERIVQQMKRISHGGAEEAQLPAIPALNEWSFAPIIAAIGPTLTLSIHTKGYVQCHLSTATLTLWLQKMLHVSRYRGRPNRLAERDYQETSSPQPYPSAPPGALIQPSTSQWAIADIPFAIFHAHARCCSILRLAHTAGQITLQSELDDTQDINQSASFIIPALRPPWAIIRPKALPWQMILSPQTHPQNWAIAQPLLVQIVTSLDRCVSLNAQSSVGSQAQKRVEGKWLKEIVDLSTAIHRFDAEVTFHGERHRVGPKETRPKKSALGHTASPLPYLGLIFIAQGLLNDLLSNFLEQVNLDPVIPDEL